ncbi:MAG: TonB-dependent receptor [Acidobacteria bacterium]|nr:TonB-dependent receptor [Acidobacteriota bacterium]
MNCRKSVLLPGLLLLHFVPTIALAQSREHTGLLAGIVRDSTGLVLPGAGVELRTLASSASVANVPAAADGTFTFTDVSFGRYRLVVTCPGFEPSDSSIEIAAGPHPAVTIVLRLSGIEEQVSVHASAADVPLTPTLQSPVSRRQIDTLPSESVSAGLSSVITLTAPGVAADSNGGFHPLGEHAETSFVIDNQPITDQQSRTFSNQLSPNAIQSLDVITGVPPAEFGDKTSLVVRAITRSGLGVGRPHGALTVGYASFRTPIASLAVGLGNSRAGNFLSLDGVASQRFLDAPEPEALHAQGNVFNLFDRFDTRWSPQTTLQLGASASRSAFETPNTYDQQDAGQNQRQRQHSFNLSPTLTHVLGPHAVVESTGWARRDVIDYLPSADLYADQPAVLAQHRSLTNAGVKASLTATAGAHAFKVGLQQTTTWLAEQFRTGLTDPAFNSPSSEGFLPALLPYDLTRGGAFFDFQGDAVVSQWAAYAQGAVSTGPWNVTAGLRVDSYRGLSRAVGWQPRLGTTYTIDRTKTVVRGSYGRMFLTPYNENLILASSTGPGGLGGGVLGSVAGAPLTPGHRQQVDAGGQQTLWRGIHLDGEYFWKVTDGAFDFDVIFNTPLAFPVQFRESRADGGLLRVTLPESHGWQAYATLSHSRSRLFGPELGGLRFSASYAPVARPDHDEALQANTHVEYRASGGLAFWSGLTWRYDSGLVAVAVPAYADALTLTGDQQAAMGLFCGDTLATRAQPIRSCASSTFGAQRINIPAPGTENDDSNPPRIVPHHVVDVAAGLDHLSIGKLPLRARVTVINLFDTVALYNFLSTFSGTHFVTPRTVRVEIGVRF